MSETTERPAVERMHPPRWLWRTVVNPVMRTLLRAAWPPPVAERLALLRFDGRRSGDRYELPVGVRDVDGLPCVLTNAGWRVNFRDGHPMALLWRGDVHGGTGVLREEPEHVAGVYRDLIEATGWEEAGRQMGIRINVDRTPTHEELVDVVGREGLAVLELHLDA